MNTSTFDITHLAILIMSALIALELVKLGTQYFFKRITKDNYVTDEMLEAKCKDCHERHTQDRRASGDQLTIMSREVREIKQILLIVALKNDISPEDLRALVG